MFRTWFWWIKTELNNAKRLNRNTRTLAPLASCTAPQAEWSRRRRSSAARGRRRAPCRSSRCPRSRRTRGRSSGSGAQTLNITLKITLVLATVRAADLWTRTPPPPGPRRPRTATSRGTPSAGTSRTVRCTPEPRHNWDQLSCVHSFYLKCQVLIVKSKAPPSLSRLITLEQLNTNSALDRRMGELAVSCILPLHAKTNARLQKNFLSILKKQLFTQWIEHNRKICRMNNIMLCSPPSVCIRYLSVLV